jgi:hypothetical protein
MTMDDYYSQMMMNHLEGRDLNDMERVCHRIDWKEWLLQLALERREWDLKIEEEKQEQEWKEEIEERAEDRREKREMMNLFLMQMGWNHIPPKKSKAMDQTGDSKKILVNKSFRLLIN